MEKIEITISRGTDGFTVYTTDSLFSGFGETLEAAKTDMTKQMDLYKETCKEDGITYPAFLDTDFEFAYKFDVQSLLEYYSGIISNAALEKMTGINKKQLWAYAHGRSKPRKNQINKIENALHNLGKELVALSF